MEEAQGPTPEAFIDRFQSTLTSATERLRELAIRTIAFHKAIGGDRERKIHKLQAFLAVVKFFQDLVESRPPELKTAAAWIASSGCINGLKCRILFITSPFAVEARICTEYVIRRMALVSHLNQAATPQHETFYKKQLAQIWPESQFKVRDAEKQRSIDERARYHIDAVDSPDQLRHITRLWSREEPCSSPPSRPPSPRKRRPRSEKLE